MPQGIYLRTEYHKKRISEGNKNRIVSVETRKKISLKLKGRISPRKGAHLSKETKRKLSIALKRRFLAEKSNRWKGNNIKYGGIHDWIKSKLGYPDKCELCEKTNLINIKDKKQVIEWANKDHKYKRNIKDWIRLCVKCHRKYDKEHNYK